MDFSTGICVKGACVLIDFEDTLLVFGCVTSVVSQYDAVFTIGYRERCS